MKPAPFEYKSPHTLPETLHIMNQHGYEAKLLAGGQSLIPVMNFRLAMPAMLVDINSVLELSQIRRSETGSLHIGAMVRQSVLQRDPFIAEFAPLIHETMPFVAHQQIRNRGTIGGSLAHADPAGELPVITVALEAKFKLQREGSARWLSAEDFFETLFTTALEPEEILTDIAIPPLPPLTGCAFLEIARRHGDYAQSGVAAVITLDENGICRQARLVFLNAGEIPMVAKEATAVLLGQKLTDDLITESVHIATQQEIAPTDDIHATAAYKRHLASVLGKRA
ncbi:MAG: xanthine dehydrogenase family protein subunit M, partial [Anaerolineae bacterium]|nr:xanthine dehydrogenase family protein subunit M [Anaerolineae bacterium]